MGTRRAATGGRFLWEGWRDLWIWGWGPTIHGRCRASHGKSGAWCRAALNGSRLDEVMPPVVRLRSQSRLWRSTVTFLVTADGSPW